MLPSACSFAQNRKSPDFSRDSGRAKEIRTPDLFNANVARYQLCYIPVSFFPTREGGSSHCLDSVRRSFRGPSRGGRGRLRNRLGVRYDWLVLPVVLNPRQPVLRCNQDDEGIDFSHVHGSGLSPASFVSSVNTNRAP